MFKSDWEKISAIHPLPKGFPQNMVSLAYPHQTLLAFELVSGGCANLNYKIKIKGENKPLILRVYLRDKHAAYREKRLATLLKGNVPVPQTYYIGELEGYHFAITEFMPGRSLRDLILGNIPHDISAIMHEIGTFLTKISAHEFPKAGFFNTELQVIPFESDDVIKRIHECLDDITVLSILSPLVVAHIKRVVAKYASLFPTTDQKRLVHGDFDPANILVDHRDGIWSVTGILDWEFAFSGSSLWDVANMLRYAHNMPSDYQSAFINALEKNGFKLTPFWRKTVSLLNLSSLLDLLKRSDPKSHPRRCRDIRELINHILSE